MEPIVFPGQYVDASGTEAIEWTILPSTRPGWDRRFEVHTSIRGVHVWGGDFDGLDADDTPDAHTRVTLNRAGEVSDCLLSGDLPCTVSVAGARRPATVHFDLDLRPQSNPDPNNANLALACEIDGTIYSVADAWFEDGLLRLERTFPTDQELTACITCLYSDYSPGGHGLTGMQCHREAKFQYLEVRSKAEYWAVPVTEDVPETYLCGEYQRRVPGTGYRG